MITYDKKEVKFSGCPGCAYYNHEFELSCGMAFRNENFTISQDWEVPIKGMMIIAPKRCINKLCELSNEERNELFYIVNKTMNILKENKVSETFVLIFDERKNVHFHVCIVPKLKWMNKLTNDIAGDLAKVIQYSKSTFIKDKDYREIKLISELVTKGMK